jgi:hypothetical protein
VRVEVGRIKLTCGVLFSSLDFYPKTFFY